MDSAQQNYPQQPPPAAVAVRNLAPGLVVRSVVGKLESNSAMKEALRHLPRHASVDGALVKAITVGTWEVSWRLGDMSVIAKHQVQWLLNTNNCAFLPFCVRPQLPADGAAAAPAPAAPNPVDQPADGGETESSSSSDEEEIIFFGPEPPPELPPEPADDHLSPHGLKWTLRTEPIRVDSRTTPNIAPHVRWKKGQSTLPTREPLVYFEHFMLPAWLECIPRWTSAKLINRRLPPMDKKEFLKWMGVLLATTFARGSKLSDLWTEKDVGFFPPARTGERHGIGRNRWNNIKSCLTLTPPGETADRWLCQWLIDEWNDWMVQCFTPGFKICVDESMFEWRGRGDYDTRGLPHVSKISRKPTGVGLELKNALCVLSGVMLRYEMLEGQAAMANRKFCEEGINKCTATTLRLVEPWFNKGRHIVGDSWFGSVQSAVELWKRGCWFTGMVKLAHREYPKHFIQNVAFTDNNKRGDTVTLTTSKDGCTVIAHGWNEPGKPKKPRKALVSTCGVTTDVEPSKRKRAFLNPETAEMDERILEVPQTHLIEEYFSGAQGIDVFNHQGQGGLRLEGLHTRDCWFRVFESMLGTVEVNSFNAYRYFEVGKDNVEHARFTEELAMQLTGFDPTAQREQVEQPAAKRHKKQVSAPLRHTILKLADTSHFKKKARAAASQDKRAVAHNKCSICGHQCYFYCRDCSQVGGKRFFNLCGPTSGRQCISEHIQTELLRSPEDDEEE